jgi:hypothetical protein
MFKPLPVFPCILGAALVLGSCGGHRDTITGPPEDLHVSCLQKPDPGPCRGSKTAFFYDYRSDSCRPFRHGGCGGNVPFATLDACLRQCRVNL